MSVAWDGADPMQQPLLPGVRAYRCMLSFSVLLVTTFFVFRIYTLGRIQSWAAVASFIVEAYLYVNLLLQVRLSWSGRDTQYTTPDYSQLLQEVTSDDKEGARSEKAYPRVAMLIPTYNEERDILEPVVRAAFALDWPADRLHVLVCDDGGREWVHLMVREVRAEAKASMKGVAELNYSSRQAPDAPVDEAPRTEITSYVRRVKKPGVPHHAKAGNLNHALFEQPAIASECDYILILDADMAPEPQLLERAMPFFFSVREGALRKNPVALVQTPQRFVNVPSGDPLDNGQLATYAWTMATFDAVGATPFCGTGAVLHAPSLIKIGGLPYGSLIEDVHTSIVLHCEGLRGRYLAESLQHGFTPNSLADTFEQRLRWCTGGVQLFRRRFCTLYFWRGRMPLLAKLSFFLNFGGDTFFLPLRLIVLVWPTLVCLLPAGTLFPVGMDETAPEWEKALSHSSTAILLIGIFVGILSLAFLPNRSRAIGAAIDVPRSHLLNLLTSAGTYLAVQLQSARDGLCPAKGGTKWKMGAKGGDGRIAGRWHYLAWFHVLLALLHSGTLLYCVIVLVCRKCDPLYAFYPGTATRASSGYSPSQAAMVYGFSALFCMMLLMGSAGVLSSYLWPLSTRRGYCYTEVDEPTRLRQQQVRWFVEPTPTLCEAVAESKATSAGTADAPALPHSRAFRASSRGHHKSGRQLTESAMHLSQKMDFANGGRHGAVEGLREEAQKRRRRAPIADTVSV